MTRKISHTYLEQQVVHSLLLVFFVLCAAYCIILISIIFSVTERKQTTLAINNLTNNLMDVENDYAGTVASLDDSTLRQMGFSRFESTQFTVRKDPIASYAILYER